MQLNDKVALVTGGTGSLGSVIAQRLDSEGARVVSTYRDSKSLNGARSSFSPGVTFIRADVTREEDVTRLFDEVLAAFDRIDVVINTVGGYVPGKPLVEVTLDEWDLMMNLNLKSTFLTTREALRRMKGQAYGRIINISAMVGLNPVPGRAPYAISKAGVSLLTDIAAREVKGSAITVNAIAPGIIATQSNIDSMPEEDGTKWVTPGQITELILFLCSPAAVSISGTTVKAPGGA